MLLPFFDGPFLEWMASAPVDWLLYHRFYHDWLARFPSETIQVPWQTYPGHSPCPVRGLEITRTQWQATRATRFRASQAFLPRCREAMTRLRFPSALIRRPVVLLAYALHVARVKDCGYIIKPFVSFSDCYERSGGRMVFPG